MGNTYGIPATSNDEWVVINIPRTCESHYCGALVIPLDHDTDARLVDNVSVSPLGGRNRNEGGGFGIVPRYEYDAKIRDFNNTIGGGRQRMMQITLVTILFVAIAPNCLRFISDDIEIWMYLVAAYVPIVIVLFFVFHSFSAERRKVKELFVPWKTQYGIDVEWFKGSKTAGAQLGFKLP